MPLRREERERIREEMKDKNHDAGNKQHASRGGF